MKPKPRLRIDFCSFWDGFDKTNNWFWHTLRQRFDLELSDQPEFLFYSDGASQAWRMHVCTRIYFSVERHLPNWSHCDYALTCHELGDPRHLRLPYFVVESDPADLIKDDGWAERHLAAQRDFCGVLISNPRARRGQRRVEFVTRLMARTHVHSGGRWNNNVGGPIRGGFPAKRAWLRQFRFNIAFENESLPGYTTEKITDAMLAGCLPVYWGNPDVGRDFNRASFLDLSDFPSDDALIEHLLALQHDNSRLAALLQEPWFPGNQPSECYRASRFLDFIEGLVAQRGTPVAQRRSWFHPGRWMLVKRNRPPAAPW
ncbi:MAG: hypothetical protein IT580_04650 [Verrucomicrobiales bacterium]|nr:hypothetical protein [Verrucomicrobiales bacterium]